MRFVDIDDEFDRFKRRGVHSTAFFKQSR
jgi:hypothetical protein